MSRPHNGEPHEVFYCYARKDKELLDELLEQLAGLRRQKGITEWTDREIVPGKEWRNEIDKHLESASVILMLVSASFLNSDYCDGVEMRRAMERHEAGAARVIPVILRPCDWEQSPLGKLQSLPTDGLPVTSWKNRDEAYKSVVDGIKRAIEELNRKRSSAAAVQNGGQKDKARSNGKKDGGEVSNKCFNNLPTPLTRFIGRENEMATIKDYLRREGSRVVVIHGIGGAGKSRLAQQVVASLANEFRNGVCLVALERITDPDLVLTTISQTLGVREVEGVPVNERLKQYLGDKHMLLLLDNFERVASAAKHIADLLVACPKIKLLLTSRKALNVRGVINYRVPPLKLPLRRHYYDAMALSQYDAVELFIDSAKVVDQDFKITDDNAPAVAEICVRLDGLPLAIELAAARIDLFSPEEMLKEMEDQLNFFVHGSVTWSKRHETMRATIAWSYDLLDKAGEKKLFRRMSVFKGGCTMEAAKQVCSAQGDLGINLTEGLQSLLENNLLRREDASRGRHRFIMPDMIREYGLECLLGEKKEEAEAAPHPQKEEIETRRRHAQFFLNLAEKAEKEITSAERGDWLELLEDEHANFQTALVWCQTAAGDDEIGLRLAGALFWFWNLRAHFTDGRMWLEGALRKNERSQPTPALAKALYAAGGLAFLQGEYSAARKRLEESVAIWRGLGEKRALAYALDILGAVALSLGDFDTALLSERESVRIFRKLNDRWGYALALNDLGNVHRLKREYAEALDSYSQSIEIWTEMRDNWGLPLTLSNLGFLDLLNGKYATARRSLKKALRIQRKIDDKLGLSATLKYLGDLTVRQGNKRVDPVRRKEAYQEAARYYSESLMLNRDVGHKQFMVACLSGLATVVGKIGQAEQAIQLFGATDLLRDSFGVPQKDVDQEVYDFTVNDVRAQFNDARAFEKAQAKGRRMGLDHAMSYALEISSQDILQE